MTDDTTTAAWESSPITAGWVVTVCDCAVEWMSLYAPRECIDQILAQHWRRTEPGFIAHVHAVHADYWLSWHLGSHTRQTPTALVELCDSWSAALEELERLSAEASAPSTAKELEEIAEYRADVEAEMADAYHYDHCEICQAERLSAAVGRMVIRAREVEVPGADVRCAFSSRGCSDSRPRPPRPGPPRH